MAYAELNIVFREPSVEGFPNTDGKEVCGGDGQHRWKPVITLWKASLQCVKSYYRVERRINIAQSLWIIILKVLTLLSGVPQQGTNTARAYTACLIICKDRKERTWPCSGGEMQGWIALCVPSDFVKSVKIFSPHTVEIFPRLVLCFLSRRSEHPWLIWRVLATLRIKQRPTAMCFRTFGGNFKRTGSFPINYLTLSLPPPLREQDVEPGSEGFWIFFPFAQFINC